MTIRELSENFHSIMFGDIIMGPPRYKGFTLLQGCAKRYWHITDRPNGGFVIHRQLESGFLGGWRFCNGNERIKLIPLDDMNPP